MLVAPEGCRFQTGVPRAKICAYAGLPLPQFGVSGPNDNKMSGVS